MRTTLLTLLATSALSVHADFTVDYQPTAPAAVTYEASQLANNPAYSAARHAIVQTALANFQTASNSVIRDDVLQTMVPKSQWDVFTSVRAVEVALDKGSAVASVTGSASASATGSASGSAATTGSASASPSASGSGSQSAGAATASSHSAAAPRATKGLTVGAVVGVMAGLVAAM